jgi:hypothetical protein
MTHVQTALCLSPMPLGGLTFIVVNHSYRSCNSPALHSYSKK